MAPIDPQLHANTVKLIELSGDRERIQSGLAQRIDDVKARLLQQLPSSDPAYSEELVDRLKSRLKVQDFIDVEVRVYEKHFTSGEIEELLGIEMARREAKPAEVPPQLKQKVASEMPAIRGEMATGFFEVGARVSGQAAAEILKEHPEYTPRKSGAAPAPHWDSTEEADMVYRTLVDRVKGGDFSVDFRTLRLACLKSSQCQPRSTPEELSEMQLAHSGHQLNRAIEIAERLINKGFVNAEVHAECFRLYSEIGDNSKASFHLQTAAALLTSILSLGDGKTKETAFEVISDREEFSVLASMGLPYFGSDVLSNSPLIDGEHHYDRWSVRNPKTGEAVELFFNTDYFVPGKSRVGNQ